MRLHRGLCMRARRPVYFHLLELVTSRQAVERERANSSTWTFVFLFIAFFLKLPAMRFAVISDTHGSMTWQL